MQNTFSHPIWWLVLYVCAFAVSLAYTRLQLGAIAGWSYPDAARLCRRRCRPYIRCGACWVLTLSFQAVRQLSEDPFPNTVSTHAHPPTAPKHTITQVHNYPNAQSPKYIIIQTYNHPSTWSPKHTITQAHNHPSTQSPKHTITQVHNHPRTQSPKYTITQTQNHPSTQSPNHTISQAHNHPSTQSPNHRITQPHNHPSTQSPNHTISQTHKAFSHPIIQPSNPTQTNHPTSNLTTQPFPHKYLP